MVSPYTKVKIVKSQGLFEIHCNAVLPPPFSTCCNTLLFSWLKEGHCTFLLLTKNKDSCVNITSGEIIYTEVTDCGGIMPSDACHHSNEDNIALKELETVGN